MAIGLGEESDDFLTVLRYAMPVDATLARMRGENDLPLVVLRIRDTRPAHQPQPYPWVAFESPIRRHAARDRPGTRPRHAGEGHLHQMGTALRPYAVVEHESIQTELDRARVREGQG